MVGSASGLALRQIRTRRLRAVLTSFGIVLGVGMVFGVLLLSGTIRQSFDDLIDSAWGSKDLIVVAQGGTLPDAGLTDVLGTAGVEDAQGMVGNTVVRLDEDGTPIDGAAGRVNVAGYDTAGTPPYDLEYTSGRPPQAGLELAIEGNWAEKQGIDVGERMRVATASGTTTLPVVGIFEFPSGLSFGGEGIAVMPIGEARELAALPHGWHQIMVEAEDRADVEALQRRLEYLLGRGVQVETPTGLGDEFKRQLDALNVVLYFFAGVALFVGGFLILNSFSMTVAQRMRELGMLRTLGAPRRMLRQSVLVEAAVLGLIGSVLGLVLGAGLALALIAFIKGIGIPVGSLQIAPSAVAIAVGLGVVATLVGAWWPARRAARVSPIVAAQGAPAARSGVSWQRVVVGLALYVPGALFGGSFWFAGDQTSSTLGTVAGIGMTMAMFLGMALVGPAIITPLVRLFARPLRRLAPTGGRLAADATRRNPGRTASTAIALTIGLSVIVVNTAMSASFVASVHDRINATYARDATVRPVGATELSARTLSPAAVRDVGALPDAAVVSGVHFIQAKLPGIEDTAQPYGLIEGVDPQTIAAVDRPEPTGIDADDVPAALARGEILIARAYAVSIDREAGDTLTIHGPAGTEELLVAGVYDQFNSFGGNNIRMSTAKLEELYGPTKPSQLLVKASSEDRRDALTAQLEQLLATEHPDLEAQSTAELKQEIDDQINQQFALFNAIVAIAIIVSLLGIINTLAMSVAERTREIGVLRALGSSRMLVRLTMVYEGLLMTTAGAVAGLALGGLIAFAWVGSLDSMLPNISFHLPAATIAGVAILSIVLGVIAALLPARRAAKLDVVDALAYE